MYYFNAFNFGESKSDARLSSIEELLKGLTTKPTQAATDPNQLLDPRLQEQFDIGLEQLQPGFAKKRTSFSEAVGGRGLGRSSTFATGFSDLLGKEQASESALFSDVLSKQIQKEQFEQAQAQQESQFARSLKEKRKKRRGGLFGSLIKGAAGFFTGGPVGAAAAVAT